jgi:OOP family OmpA-OmpF porin
MLRNRLNLDLIKKISVGMALIALSACSSGPTVAELPANTDPQQEFNKLGSDLQDAQKRQVDVLSPKYFESASDSLDKAKNARSRNKDQKDVLHYVALSLAYLDKANANANVANQVFPDVIQKRQDALAAQSYSFYQNEMKDADKELKEASREIEENDTSKAQKDRGELVSKYSELEIDSIKRQRLGTARANVEQAKHEGAAELAPQTLAWAEKEIQDQEAVIVANKHDSATLDKASATATAASTRLLNMERQAKAAKGKNPEQLATQLEKDQIKVDNSQQALAKTSEELAAESKSLSAEQAQTRDLEEKGKLEKQYAEARKTFTPEEAEVYKQGDHILLRLKGLNFPSNQAIITTSNYGILAKVKKVIKEVDPASVVIEGHTDSVGAKNKNMQLSEKRANAVESYLVSNEALPADKIEAKGYGDTKPITSNKTADGRAQNRRVDVILNAQN